MKLSDFKTDLEGIEFLRNLVNFLDCRDEHYNSNKTPNQLINEYLKYCNDEIDIYGNKID